MVFARRFWGSAVLLKRGAHLFTKSVNTPMAFLCCFWGIAVLLKRGAHLQIKSANTPVVFRLSILRDCYAASARRTSASQRCQDSNGFELLENTNLLVVQVSRTSARHNIHAVMIISSIYLFPILLTFARPGVTHCVSRKFSTFGIGGSGLGVGWIACVSRGHFRVRGQFFRLKGGLVKTYFQFLCFFLWFVQAFCGDLYWSLPNRFT